MQRSNNFLFLISLEERSKEIKWVRMFLHNSGVHKIASDVHHELENAGTPASPTLECSNFFLSHGLRGYRPRKKPQRAAAHMDKPNDHQTRQKISYLTNMIPVTILTKALSAVDVVQFV